MAWELMTTEDLYELAKKEGACKDGLLWLKEWMDKHPNKMAHHFFKSINKQRYNNFFREYQYETYLRWVLYNLIDYTTTHESKFLIIERVFPNYNYFLIPSCVMAETLAKTFKRGYLEK